MDYIGKNLIEFYGKDELMARFGTLQPTAIQRANEMEFLWFLYGDEHEIYKHDLDLDEFETTAGFVNMLRKTYGPFNVLSRGLRIRFKDEANAVFIRLKYSKV